MLLVFPPPSLSSVDQYPIPQLLYWLITTHSCPILCKIAFGHKEPSAMEVMPHHHDGLIDIGYKGPLTPRGIDSMVHIYALELSCGITLQVR